MLWRDIPRVETRMLEYLGQGVVNTQEHLNTDRQYPTAQIAR